MMIAKVINLSTDKLDRKKVLMLNNGKTMMMIACREMMIMIGYHWLIAGRVMIMMIMCE